MRKCEHGVADGAWCDRCTLASFAHSEIRAECARRGIRLDEECREECAAFGKTTAERDEWKRRAEAAEAKFAKELAKNAVNGIVIAPCSAPMTCSCRACERAFRMKNEGFRPMFLSERGPGIAATPAPDAGHYIDPLDLLCEDA
jgi:hypothetical protein